MEIYERLIMEKLSQCKIEDFLENCLWFDY